MSPIVCLPSPRDPATAALAFDIPARKPWSHLVKKGETLRIVDALGQQAVDTLFYNAHDYTERYSAQDTLREQGSAYVVAGTALVSNEGRIMARVVANTGGAHDTSAGRVPARATPSASAITSSISTPAARTSSWKSRSTA